MKLHKKGSKYDAFLMCGEALKGSDSHFLVKRMTHLRNLIPFLTFN